MGRSYTVQSGDNLSTIARNNNTTVDELMRLNPSITDANLIYTGSVINLPDTASGTTAADGTVSGGGSLPVNGTKVSSSSGSGSSYTMPSISAPQSSGASDTSRLEALEQYLADTVGDAPTESELLNSIRDQILNRESFSYDPNTDPFWGQYLDNAMRKGKTAMQDTMGKAAALTGGYANSWGQSAGQQAYNQYIQDANEMLPEFEELARARYDAETAALNDRYSLLYGEHRDSVSDWENRYSIARDDWNNEQDRQFNEEQAANDEFWRQAEYLYQIGDWDSLDSMGFDTTNLREQYTDTGTTTTTTTSGYDDEDEDEVEDFRLWNYSGTDDNGNSIFYDESGKKKIVERGINPYTGSRNPDIDNGVFSNGYQPNNVAGSKLSKSGWMDEVNGRTQNVWLDESGLAWIWDGSQNRYREYMVGGKQATKAIISNMVSRG